MKTFLTLLVLVSITCGLQFEDDAVNLGHTKQSENEGGRGFFPSEDEPDKRYSEESGIKYVDPQILYDGNRKQLNFNGNSNRVPSGSNQIYQQNPYVPVQTINPSLTGINVIRKRPPQYSYQQSKPPLSNYYNSPSTDLSNPFYQNYANHYQYPSAAATSYPDYYNPTRYPSPASANSNGQQQILHQPSLQYPNYYTNNYANQYGYQRPSSIYGSNGVGSGLSSLFNNIRESPGPLGQFSQVSGQFAKALEDISAHDELQCVPKIVCQMVRGSRRQSQMPSFLSYPGVPAIISALPSSSPLMNFGRAALLGLSGSAECDSAYPRCPRDEEQMLHYLNNHRGGFFRFFNGGHSFGDDNYIQQQQQVEQQQNPGGFNLLALQSLADTLNQGNGINLNNLFSSPTIQRPTVQNYQQGLQADQSQSGGLFGMFKPNMFTDAVSNLLTGIVGNRFSRRLSKRSLPDESTLEGQHKIQKRIVNLKSDFSSKTYDGNFYHTSSSEQRPTTLFDVEAPFTFPSTNRINNLQQISSMRFPQPQVSGQQETLLTQINQANSISPSDVARLLKMLFPEATGNLRFEDDQYNRELLRKLVNDRIGKIVTGVKRPTNNNYDINRNQYHSSASNNNNQNYPAQAQNYYAGTTTSSNYNNFNANHGNKGQGSRDQSHIVYITNSKGQIEYTLDEKTGEKKRYY